MPGSLAASYRPSAIVWGGFLVLCLCGGGGNTPVAAQVEADTARVTIQGQVVDEASGAPIAGAVIRFKDTDFEAQTDARGHFVLSGLLKGSYTMVVEARGYETRGGALRVIRSGTLTLPLRALASVARQESPSRRPSSRVLGRVAAMETGKAMEGAEVTLEGAPGSRVTDAQGHFEFPIVPPGDLVLSVAFLGRAPLHDTVDVAPGTTVELDIRLAVKPVELKPMVVVATPRSPYLEDMGYYHRIEMGYSGKRISRQTIEERAPRHLGDLLASVSGIRVQYGGAGGFQVRMSRVIRFNDSGSSGCVPAVYLDDVPVEVGWLESVRPDRVEGVEIYTGANSPLRYNNPCGVILVWTRRGK